MFNRRDLIGLCFVCAIWPVGCTCTRPDRSLEAGPPASSPMRGARSVRPVEGIPAFAKVSEKLYRGGQPSRIGFVQLKKMGIRTVISLRFIMSDRDKLSGTGLQYLHVHFNPFHPEGEDVLAFLKVVSEPENQPVFVHCRRGADRTGMMVAIYRMVIKDWPREEAVAEMKAMGFNEKWGSIARYVESLDVAEIRKRLASCEPVKVERIQWHECGRGGLAGRRPVDW